MCQRLGRPEWILDERFITNEVRVKNREILLPMIREVTKQKTTQVSGLCHGAERQVVEANH